MSVPTLNLQNINRDQSIYSVLQSIAMQEAALSHILNADGEKMQLAAALADPLSHRYNASITLGDLFDVSRSVKNTINTVTNMELFLQEKLASTLKLVRTIPPPPKPVPPVVQLAEVVFQVVGEDTLAGLPNARFVAEAQGTARAGTQYNATADANGMITFRLPEGTYRMWQKYAPKGYASNPNQFEIVAASDGSYTVNGQPSQTFTTVEDAVSTGPAEPIDEPPPELPGIYQPGEYCLTCYVLSANTEQPVANAKFTLSGNGITPITKTADFIGALNFGVLAPGTYTLTQDGAISGWVTTPVHTITVEDAGTQLPDGTSVSHGTVLLDGDPSMKVLMSRQTAATL